MQFLPMALESPGLARRRLVVDLQDAGVAGEIGDDAALVLSELVSNAVRHGVPIRSPLGRGLGVEWAITASDVTITVLDAGDGPAPPQEQVDHGAESGRGLGIVAGLAAEWGVRPMADPELAADVRGTAVWARLRR